MVESYLIWILNQCLMRMAVHIADAAGGITNLQELTVKLFNHWSFDSVQGTIRRLKEFVWAEYLIGCWRSSLTTILENDRRPIRGFGKVVASSSSI
ncbi:hypothetical protein AAG906_037520 [Vitis piasezkii]